MNIYSMFKLTTKIDAPFYIWFTNAIISGSNRWMHFLWIRIFEIVTSLALTIPSKLLYHVYFSQKVEMGMTEPPTPPWRQLGFTKIFFNEPEMPF